MQGGAQASQALHRIVIGMRKGQQLARGLAALELRSISISTLLCGTVAYTGRPNCFSILSGSSTTGRMAQAIRSAQGSATGR